MRAPRPAGSGDGAAATLGITAGCVVHTLAAALGLSALIAASATAFTAWSSGAARPICSMRCAHALRAPRCPRPRTRRGSLAPARAGAIVREAFVINVFNPKVALFFLAFLPQFIAADAPHPALAFVLARLRVQRQQPVRQPAGRVAREPRGRGYGGRARAPAASCRAPWARLFMLLAARLATLERT